MSNTTPAGWYAQADGHQRYWDGLAWTEHVAPGVGSSVVAASAAVPQAVYGGQVVHGALVVRKSPGLALLCSFFITGLGQIVNGEVGKGIGFFAGACALSLTAFVLSFVLIGFLLWPFVLGLWIWTMVDAYQVASRWNAAHGLV